MPGRGGRPKHAADEVCSCQGSNSPGFRYIDTVKKDGNVYYYSKFKHADHTIADHVIQSWEPQDHDLTEFNRSKNETTVFGRKGARSSKIWHVVIYDMNRIKQKQKQKDLAAELRKLHIPILKVKDLLWFLKPKRSERIDPRASRFLSTLSKFLEDSDDLIITYGDLDLNEADRIAYLFDCDMTPLIDKFGILKQFERRIKMREIQKESYNKPQPTFQNLITPKE
jgi:hypothetical protein